MDTTHRRRRAHEWGDQKHDVVAFELEGQVCWTDTRVPMHTSTRKSKPAWRRTLTRSALARTCPARH